MSLTKKQIAETHAGTIETLRKHFGTRETLSFDEADRLADLLDRAAEGFRRKENAIAFFECLAEANIKFVSGLARNRVHRLKNQ